MIARKRGKIINIASVQTRAARPTIAPYTATKGAVGNLTPRPSSTVMFSMSTGE